MRIFVSQIYIEAGVSFPFTVHFQGYISDQLSQRISPSESFVQEFADDFDLIFNMSAKAGIGQPEVKGPTIFKKDKDVEYTIFLPFDRQSPPGQDVYRQALRQLLDQVINVLDQLEMDVSRLARDSDDIIERIVIDPQMIERLIH